MNKFLDRVHTAYTKDKNASASIKAYEKKIAYLKPKIKNYGKKAQEKGVMQVYKTLTALINSKGKIKGMIKKLNIKQWVKKIATTVATKKQQHKSHKRPKKT